MQDTKVYYFQMFFCAWDDLALLTLPPAVGLCGWGAKANVPNVREHPDNYRDKNAKRGLFFSFVLLSRWEKRSTEKVTVPRATLIICVFGLLSMNCGTVPEWSKCPPLFLFLIAQKCQVTAPLSTEKKGCSQLLACPYSVVPSRTLTVRLRSPQVVGLVWFLSR